MKCLYPIADNDVFVFSMGPIDSKMYCIVRNQRALIIDTVISDDAICFLKENELKDLTIILTHEHIDHICGVNKLRECFQCKVICSAKCANLINDSRKNGSLYFEGMYSLRSMDEQRAISKLNLAGYVCEADESFDVEVNFIWEYLKIKCIELPGHSIGGIGIIINDKYVFSGDNFIPNVPTITKLPGGSKKEYEKITKVFFENLSSGSVIYPGHGEVIIK